MNTETYDQDEIDDLRATNKKLARETFMLKRDLKIKD